MFRKLFKFLEMVNNPSSVQQYVPGLDTDKKIIKLFSNNFHKGENIHQLESWLFYSYFNDSDNPTEKKYKIAILGLVCKKYNISLSKIPIINDIVDVLSKELIACNETSISLNDVFPIFDDNNYIDILLSLKSLNSIKPTGFQLISMILDEDNNSPEKIDIAKKVYKKFSPLGLLANNFINVKYRNDIFMRLQESKFTDADINVFKNFIKKVTNPKYNDYHSVNLSIKEWDILISHENNINNLEVFKELYLNSYKMKSYPGSFYSTLVNHNTSDSNNVNKQYLIDLVEKRIEYLEMDNVLSKPSETQNKKIKKAKL